MAGDDGTGRAKDKPGRIGRGFVRAGGLIDGPMRTAAARRGFAQARLRALWPEIAGPEFAAICAPLKLARARGPAGGLLTVAVAGPHAPQLQMLLPLLRERVNAALGPGAVGRIQLTQAGRGFAEAPAAFKTPAHVRPEVDLGPVADELSSIGDADLRDALETLARNVLSRSRTSNPPES
ncbi:MAG TPA: DciA family protein [Hyphomicrobiaceae bacterium]